MAKLISSLLFRVKNWKTTVGGGVLGVVGAALLSQVEEASGCHFQKAFAGLNWGHILIFTVAQVLGLSVTDGHKTVENAPVSK